MTTASATPRPIAESGLKAVYERDGFVVVRGLFDERRMREAAAEAVRLRADYDQLRSVKSIRCRWQDTVFTGVCTFETFDPVIDIGPVCSQIALHPRLLGLLAILYGEPACLFKDKLIYKPPGVK